MLLNRLAQKRESLNKTTDQTSEKALHHEEKVAAESDVPPKKYPAALSPYENTYLLMNQKHHQKHFPTSKIVQTPP